MNQTAAYHSSGGIHCTLCGADAHRRLFDKYGRSFYACGVCGVTFLAPQPTDEELAAMYTEEYYASWGLDREFSVVREMKTATFAEKLARVAEHVPTGRLLDIGCAAGFLLEAARDRGWDGYGVELSRFSAEIAQHSLGAEKVFNGTLEGAAYPDDFFDVVFMSDLIEHIKDLPTFLREVRRILRPGGFVAIMTPDAASLTCRLMGRAWPHYKEEHLFYFSPESLTRLLASYGFRTRSTAPAAKALTLAYTVRQLTTYPLPLVTTMVRFLARLLPERIRNRPFMVRTGELLALATKEASP